MKRTMRWTVYASSICLWLGAGAGCGAGGSEGQGVEVRQNEPGPGVLPPPPKPGDQVTPGIGPTGPDFNLDEEDPGTPAEGCQQAERSFEPNIPTVYLLVDRSATMFDPIIDNVSAWSALRGGALEVMRELEGNVRFGFAAFSGGNLGVSAGVQQCQLEVPAVPPTLNNYQAIAQLYEPMGQPTTKETPTVLALRAVAQQLREDTTVEGDKYILFVTDGEPDYCDDNNPVCPPDSVVGLLQSLAAEVDATGAPQTPIRTLVFGVSSPTATIRAEVLQAFANAGAGQPVAPALQNAAQAADPNFLYDQCNGQVSWASDFAATGKPAVRGETIGTYVTDPTLAGTAPVFRPDPTDQAALADQLRTALASVKSCTFDLGEDGVQVDLARRDLGERARVIINGAPVAFDAANGWSMATETTVTLSGQACETWRDPLAATSISFDFPCEIFVPL